MKTDSLYIIEVQSSPDYDYISEIDQAAGEERKIGETIRDFQLRDLLDRDAMKGVSIIVCIALVVGLVMLFISKLKMSDDIAGGESGSMGSDTIYGHSWEEEMQQLMAARQYSEVVVLCYLHWLSRLDGEGIIKYSKAKTPGMFMKEVEQAVRDDGAQESEASGDTRAVCDHKAIDATRTLTQHYLRIRYGHRQATEQQAHDMLHLSKSSVITHHSSVISQ